MLHASYDVPGARLLDLVTVMDRLRTECPWDREQTHRSLAKYLLEETYETLEAIEHAATTPHLREELGDLLLQVYFHARIAARGRRRTASPSTTSPPASSTSWCTGTRTSSRASTSPTPTRSSATGSALKAAEKGRASVLDGHPARAAGAGAGRQGARPGRQGRRDAGPPAVPGPPAVAGPRRPAARPRVEARAAGRGPRAGAARRRTPAQRLWSAPPSP